MSDTSESWAWYWGEGVDSERYDGPFASREDAVSEATEIGVERGYLVVTVMEAKRMALRDDIFDADNVLEQWHDCNEEAQDEDGELGMSPSHEQKVELEATLSTAFAAWRAKHNLGRAWMLGEMRNEEEIAIPAPQEGATP